MGGGKGGGGASSHLAHMAQAFFTESTPARQELLKQFEEVLTTGGVGARQPIIRKAVEGSKRATSTSLQALEGDLARTGLAGTPFGENIRAGTRREGEFATSQIAPNMAMQLMQMIPNFLLGQSNVAVSGLGQAASAQQQRAGTGPEWLNALTAAITGGAALCDRRLKKNVKALGTFMGIPLYEFEYLWDSIKRIGPMAQDLLLIKPEAVFVHSSGYYGVYLTKLF